MASRFTCRVCLQSHKDHIYSFFYSYWSKARVSWSFENDGLPQHICRSCKLTALDIEKKLKFIQARAKKSYDDLSRVSSTPTSLLSGNQMHTHTVTHTSQTHTENRKRPKNTSSSTGVSPFTVRSRPPCKKLTTKRLFDNEPRKYANDNINKFATAKIKHYIYMYCLC